MSQGNSQRARQLFDAEADDLRRQTDRLFAALMAFQWVAAIVVSITVSPRTWAGSMPSIHVHVVAGVGIGGLLAIPPILLARIRPGAALTRYVIAAAQMLFSALFIHLSGGRIETHFHVFGSLAFLAFYRDWRVLVPATVVIAADHLVRGIFWPESVFGVIVAAPWRAAEHAGWVLFEDAFLAYSCVRSIAEMRVGAQRQADLEAMNAAFEEKVAERTRELQEKALSLKEQVAERERTEDALVQAHGELQIREHAMNAACIVAITDLDGTILHANQRFSDISGYTNEELIGQNHRIVNSGHHPKTFFTDMYATIGRGRIWRGEVCNRTKDGSLYWVDTTIVPIPGANGRPEKYIAMRVDITERKRLESQLVQAQKLESIGQLAAGIAHEINTPTQYVSDNFRFIEESFGGLITVADKFGALIDPKAPPRPWAERIEEIRGTLDEVDFEFLREEIPSAIAQGLEGLERITHIVLAMKDFSHPGSTEKSPADLNKAIDSTVTVCRNRWKYVADLELDLDPDLPPVPVLAAEFNQAVLNIVVNAADAIAERRGGESPKGRIRISTRVDGDHAEVVIADDGGGIPESVAARVFDPFFTTKGVGKGTGQGLGIARSVVVDKHDGQLAFETEPGHGTTFTIRLPLKSKATMEHAA